MTSPMDLVSCVFAAAAILPSTGQLQVVARMLNASANNPNRLEQTTDAPALSMATNFKGNASVRLGRR